MIDGARYGHTNLIARDWRRLAGFYTEPFGCVLVPPERNYSGQTLEIFTYSEIPERTASTPNTPGFGHIAFQVDSVSSVREQVIAAGGNAVGEVVTSTTSAGAQVTLCYVTDPEGNIIELQSWRP